MALSAEVSARLWGEDKQSSTGKPHLENHTSTDPSADSTPKPVSHSEQSADPASSSASTQFDIEKLLSSGSLGNNNSEIPSPAPPPDFDLDKLLSSNSASINQAPEAVLPAQSDQGHQSSIDGPSVENPDSKAEAPDSNVFAKMLKGRAKLPKAFKGTVLDTDAIRAFAQSTKNKEEARRKEEIEFLVAPSKTKPSCPIVKFRKTSGCPVSWDELSGGSTGLTRVRYCDHCQLHIYDLDGLEESEAEELVVQREGQSIVNYYRRRDKKFQVKDCRFGAKERFVRRAGIAAAVIAVVGLAVLALTIGPKQFNRIAEQSSVVETAAGTKPLLPNIFKPKSKQSQDSSTSEQSPTVAIPEITESSEDELNQPPVPDESGVLSHPYMDRKVTPPGGY
jgi:hypothetical protein